jgi:hypothetical protein
LTGVAGIRGLRHAAAKLVTLPVFCVNGALGPGPLWVNFAIACCVAGEVISTLVNALGAEAWRPAPDGEPALLNARGQRLTVVVGPVSPPCEAIDPATGRAITAEHQLKLNSVSIVLTMA